VRGSFSIRFVQGACVALDASVDQGSTPNAWQTEMGYVSSRTHPTEQLTIYNYWPRSRIRAARIIDALRRRARKLAIPVICVQKSSDPAR
jgi:hypothetical protein